MIQHKVCLTYQKFLATPLYATARLPRLVLGYPVYIWGIHMLGQMAYYYLCMCLLSNISDPKHPIKVVWLYSNFRQNFACRQSDPLNLGNMPWGWVISACLPAHQSACLPDISVTQQLCLIDLFIIRCYSSTFWHTAVHTVYPSWVYPSLSSDGVNCRFAVVHMVSSW